MSEPKEDVLRRLDALVGEWTTESTHPAIPDTIVHGQASFEWFEGEKFLVRREHLQTTYRRVTSRGK